MSSTTAPVVWPTASELQRVTSRVANAWERVDSLRQRMASLVDEDVAPSTDEAVRNGAGPLTAKVVGDLSGCLARLRFDIEYMLADVRAMEKMRDTMALEMVLEGTEADDA